MSQSLRPGLFLRAVGKRHDIGSSLCLEVDWSSQRQNKDFYRETKTEGKQAKFTNGSASLTKGDPGISIATGKMFGIFSGR